MLIEVKPGRVLISFRYIRLSSVRKNSTRDNPVHPQARPAIQEALQVDDRIVAEKGLKNFKEIEVAVLGNHHPIASRPGRILSATEVYTYESRIGEKPGEHAD